MNIPNYMRDKSGYTNNNLDGLQFNQSIHDTSYEIPSKRLSSTQIDPLNQYNHSVDEPINQ